MNRRRRDTDGADAARANPTPMIDVVFLLIIFFMLVAQMQRARTVEMELPTIDASRAGGLPEGETIAVNVLPSATGPRYRVDGREYGASATELARLAALCRDAGRPILVRAPADAPYDAVGPVLDALGAAQAGRLHLVALPGVESPS